MDGVAIGQVMVDRAVLESRFSYCNPRECANACCRTGAAVSLSEIERIERHLPDMASCLRPEAIRLINRKPFYHKASVDRGDLGTDEECHYLRVVGGSCIFTSPSPTQGCALQLFCQAKGMNHWNLKPFVCRIFPLCLVRGGRIELTPWQLPCLQPERNYGAPLLYQSCATELRLILGDGGYSRLCQVAGQRLAQSRLR